VGRLKTTTKRGKATLSIKVRKAATKMLEKRNRAKLSLTIKATGPNVRSATLKKSVTLKH
jgi:hypothetical protein